MYRQALAGFEKLLEHQQFFIWGTARYEEAKVLCLRLAEARKGAGAKRPHALVFFGQHDHIFPQPQGQEGQGE